MQHLNEYFQAALAIHAAASAICALTPTPRDDQAARKAYKVIEDRKSTRLNSSHT